MNNLECHCLGTVWFVKIFATRITIRCRSCGGELTFNTMPGIAMPDQKPVASGKPPNAGE